MLLFLGENSFFSAFVVPLLLSSIPVLYKMSASQRNGWLTPHTTFSVFLKSISLQSCSLMSAKHLRYSDIFFSKPKARCKLNWIRNNLVVNENVEVTANMVQLSSSTN